MNIILVILDSLRKDCIGTYGQPEWWPVRTPNLDALAEESLVMDRCHSIARDRPHARRRLAPKTKTCRQTISENRADTTRTGCGPPTGGKGFPGRSSPKRMDGP